MDEITQIIDQLKQQEASAIRDIDRLQARLLIKLAEAFQRDEKSRKQTIKAIAEGLNTQRLIRQVIGRPRNPKGTEHGKA